jgi:hypothetical protein
MANGINLTEGVSIPHSPPQVHAAVKAQTDRTWMLWSPNFLFANDNDLTQLHGGCDFFQVVNGSCTFPVEPLSAANTAHSIIGLSLYSFVGSPHQNAPPAADFVSSMLHRFDQVRRTMWREL